MPVPFLLGDATATLYHADANGNAILDAPVWWNQCLRGFNAGQTIEYREQKAVTGIRDIPVSERFNLEFERIWLMDTASLEDWSPAPGETYALKMHWRHYDLPLWYSATYRNCRLESRQKTSQGVGHSVESIRFRSRGRPIEADGNAAVPTIAWSEDFDEVPVGFFYENVMAAGKYFLGHYAWAQPVQLVSAKVRALAGQGGSTTVSLEKNGVATGLTLSIPAGTAGTEVSVETSLGNHAVAAGDELRWKVTSVPGTPPSGAAITVQVTI